MNETWSVSGAFEGNDMIFGARKCASKSLEPGKLSQVKLSSDGHKRYQVSWPMANKIRSRFFHHMSTWATFFGGGGSS